MFISVCFLDEATYKLFLWAIVSLHFPIVVHRFRKNRVELLLGFGVTQSDEHLIILIQGYGIAVYKMQQSFFEAHSFAIIYKRGIIHFFVFLHLFLDFGEFSEGTIAIAIENVFSLDVIKYLLEFYIQRQQPPIIDQGHVVVI